MRLVAGSTVMVASVKLPRLEPQKVALERADVPRSRDDGMHALRHWLASALLEAGVSIKAVSEYLGHTDPGFTLRTYTHLMADSTGRARKAIDGALYRDPTADGPMTAQRGG